MDVASSQDFFNSSESITIGLEKFGIVSEHQIHLPLKSCKRGRRAERYRHTDININTDTDTQTKTDRKTQTQTQIQIQM